MLMETSQIEILREKEKRNPRIAKNCGKILKGVTGMLKERENRTDEIF